MTVLLAIAASTVVAWSLTPTASAQVEPPACAYGDVVVQVDHLSDHAFVLLDTTFRLPATPDPSDLVRVREAGFPSDHLVRGIVIDDLRTLREDAEAAGLALDVVSAYRSFDYQRQVYGGWVARLGEARARRVSARPGHSEHQLGTAVDLGSRGGPAPWDLDDWADTPEGAWVVQHAHRYGFVLSYPAGEEDRTCYDYEPWHYRWVGRDLAAAVHAAGVPYRVWLWRNHPPTEQR